MSTFRKAKQTDITENTTNQPIVNQRCFFAGIGFGTIREIRGSQLKNRFDAGRTLWKNLSEVELVVVQPAARMQDTDPLAPNYNDPFDEIEWY